MAKRTAAQAASEEGVGATQKAEDDFTPAQIDKISELVAALMPYREETADGISPADGTADLYILKYRRGTTGVQTGFIRATSQERAEKVGNTYCNSMAGSRYINVVKAVLADETILAEKGKGADQREQLANIG